MTRKTTESYGKNANRAQLQPKSHHCTPAIATDGGDSRVHLGSQTNKNEFRKIILFTAETE